MKKKGKLKTIADAFKGELPVNEKWFQDRLAICKLCEHNTANKDKAGIKLDLQNQYVCSNNSSCTACGCCIDEKASQKTEACGLVEKGLEPKWEALMLETSNSKDLNVEIVDNSALRIELDPLGTHFILNTHDMTKEDMDIELIVSRTDGLRIHTVKASCGCTTPTVIKIDDNSIKLKLRLQSSQFTKGSSYTKSVTVNYFVGTGTNKGIIKIKGKKK